MIALFCAPIAMLGAPAATAMPVYGHGASHEKMDDAARMTRSMGGHCEGSGEKDRPDLPGQSIGCMTACAGMIVPSLDLVVPRELGPSAVHVLVEARLYGLSAGLEPPPPRNV